ncbi:unnamed protein product [Amaranthus hypochondriacus]
MVQPRSSKDLEVDEDGFRVYKKKATQKAFEIAQPSPTIHEPPISKEINVLEDRGDLPDASDSFVVIVGNGFKAFEDLTVMNDPNVHDNPIRALVANPIPGTD